MPAIRTLQDKPCPKCGKMFRPLASNKVYCSNECYLLSRRGKPTWNKGLKIKFSDMHKNNIKTALLSQEYKDSRKTAYVCKGCGKKMENGYTKLQIYCNSNCKYKALSANPIEKRAFTLSSNIAFGKGKKEFFVKLVTEHLNKHCIYCKDMLKIETMSLDHIIPFGETKWRNNKLYQKQLNKLENLQIICKRCNQMKGNLPHAKFVKLLTFLNTDLEIKKYVIAKMAQGSIMWSFKRRLKQ